MIHNILLNIIAEATASINTIIGAIHDTNTLDSNPNLLIIKLIIVIIAGWNIYIYKHSIVTFLINKFRIT